MSPRTDARRRLGSIRVSLVLLALVPSVILSAIWGVTTTRILGEGMRLRSQTDLSKSTGALGTDVTLALQKERRLSAQQLAVPGSAVARLDGQRQQTDAVVRKLVSRAGELKKAPARIRDRIFPVTAAAESLEYYRDQVDNPTDINAQQILAQYTSIIESQISAFQELSQVDDGDLTSEAGPLVSLEHAAELVSQEDAILTLAWPERRLSDAQYAEFSRLVGARRWLVDTQIVPFLSGSDKAAAEQFIAGDDWRTMESVEDDVIQAHAATRGSSSVVLPDMPGQWRSAVDRLSAQQSRLIERGNTVLLDHSSAKARDLLRQAAWINVGGLAAVVLCVVLSWRITRSLSRRLRGLREATLGLAHTRLPDVVDRLNRGERIDVDAEAPALDYGRDELGQVAQAFNTAQRTAVNTAVELAETRRGFQKVILGVARHTQNLVNRQLSTLDALEREHQDPVVLRGLYELDSTASQMRRYEENLVIISGGQPGRRWTEPVAVVDVLRSAIGEVAEYPRVSVHVDGEMWLAAPVVADVIHLLAEVIENATVFSPAPSPVRVRADLVVKGLAIEVEDRGVGMTEDDYAALNRQLAEPPRFDVVALADDPRLGMFVIGRLAARNGITVTIRSSPYGGTAAIVLIPDGVVVRADPDTADPYGRSAQTPGAALPRRTPAGGPGTVTPAGAASARPTASARPSVPAGSVSAPVGYAASAPAAGPLSGRSYGANRSGGLGGSNGTSPVGAERPAPVRGPVRAASAAAGADGAEGLVPLPRRVPQSSLAAELRHEPADGPAFAGGAVDHPARSARQAASCMSAFQRGTHHARMGSDDTDADEAHTADSFFDRHAAPRHARAQSTSHLSTPTKDA